MSSDSKQATLGGVPVPSTGLPHDGHEYIGGTHRPKEKGLMEKMVYEIGVTYGTGIAVGGLYGAVTGYTSMRHENLAIVKNSIVNGSTRYGSSTANTFAAMSK
jgi:hypothetical protein